MKFIVQPDFLSTSDVEFIKTFERPESGEIQNYHIKSVNEAVNGWSAMFDISHTPLTEEVVRFQGDGTLGFKYPSYYIELGHRIASAVGVSAENMFFQYIVVGAGGEVRKHYDAGKPGYVTYKCNVVVEGPLQDIVYVGDEVMHLTPSCLYCFEANLYKHWMTVIDSPRIHLSYGFIVPYADLGWDEHSPRVRLSNRIWKAYIS